MKSFLRSDGRPLAVIEGFRERVLSYRPSVSPRAGWTEEQFAASAKKKLKRAQRLLESFTRWIPTLEGARVLDVGCGDGANCTLLGSEPVSLAVGLDLHLPRFAPGDEGQRARMLLERVADAGAERGQSATALLSDRRVCFIQMDATRLGFRPESFDVVMSRSAAEHIQPIERALVEIERAVRPGGLIYLGIDPFYWLRGCHKRGVVDIPFAHARLSLEEYRRFVAENEGEAAAATRWRRIATLNRLTARQWRRTIQAMSCDILEWREGHSELGAAVLDEFPDIPGTLLEGVAESDLLTERIEAWLRKH
jgi:SAM-dependent methyltransferase